MFSKTSTKLSVDDLKSVEIKLGLILPDQLANHYLQFNGGIPDKPVFYSEKSDIETRIQVFLPMRNSNIKGLPTFEEMYLKLKEQITLLSRRYLPFAHDGGANPFCVDLETGNIVIIWLDIGIVDNKAIKYLANDFNDFIVNLENEEDDC